MAEIISLEDIKCQSIITNARNCSAKIQDFIRLVNIPLSCEQKLKPINISPFIFKEPTTVQMTSANEAGFQYYIVWVFQPEFSQNIDLSSCLSFYDLKEKLQNALYFVLFEKERILDHAEWPYIRYFSINVAEIYDIGCSIKDHKQTIDANKDERIPLESILTVNNAAYCASAICSLHQIFLFRETILLASG
jgi:hypothetical protein